ncbi:metallophosphoesterase [Thermotoga sp. KOL6]|uniref:metallophosphoesterase family protein n=1 Tax=Thermotoga sp. KOL6 TaxID=126741 RepID=UPI000CC17C42|nr:metallophosphoesterase [Thermotoga sp. KOL6]PLV60109.1 metallophosphoesterase [Thermotoga sp. KOL6]
MKTFLTITALAMIVISGLKFLDTYFFVVSEKDLIYKTIQNVEKEQLGDEFTFIVFGDNKNSVSTFSKLIDAVNKEKAIAFGVNTGDMVFDGSMFKWQLYLKQLKRFKIPVFHVPGNHDLADHPENYMKIFGPLYYSFQTGNSYFIVVNNANEDIDAYQLEWLKNELGKSQSWRYRFVFMHVPIFDPRVKKQPGHSMKNLKKAQDLLSLLKKYHVTRVFAGHIHGYFEGEWDGVPYTITGGAGAELFGIDPEHYFYHFIKVHVTPENVSYEIIKLPTPDFNIIDRTIHTFWIYTYSFVLQNYWIVLLGTSLFLLSAVVVSGKERELFEHLMKRKIVRFVARIWRLLGNQK